MKIVGPINEENYRQPILAEGAVSTKIAQEAYAHKHIIVAPQVNTI